MDVDHAEVEAAIAAVPGVAQALVRPDAETGRTRLRIALAPNGDPDDVAHAVSTLLRERFRVEVDPSAIRPRPIVTTPTMLGDGEGGPDVWRSPVTPGAAEAPAGAATVTAERVDAPSVVQAAGLDVARPRIRDLRVEEVGVGIDVEVALEIEGREYRGRASGAAIEPYRLQAVARATVAAIDQLFPHRARLEVDSVVADHDRPQPVVLSTVTLVTKDGPTQLIGVAFLRNDPPMSTLKATLDAINRPVGMLVADLG